MPVTNLLNIDFPWLNNRSINRWEFLFNYLKINGGNEHCTIHQSNEPVMKLFPKILTKILTKILQQKNPLRSSMILRDSFKVDCNNQVERGNGKCQLSNDNIQVTATNWQPSLGSEVTTRRKRAHWAAHPPPSPPLPLCVSQFPQIWSIAAAKTPNVKHELCCTSHQLPFRYIISPIETFHRRVSLHSSTELSFFRSISAQKRHKTSAAGIRLSFMLPF